MRAKTRSYYETAVTEAVTDIVADLNTALDLESLAERAATSQFHFHRIFRGMVGETPLGLRRRLLLERAAWRLGNSRSSVLDIAIGAGFETHEAFTRAFRGAYTTTPTEFRKTGYLPINLAAICGLHYQAEGVDPSAIVLETGETNMQVDIVERPDLRLATVQHIGPYNQVGAAFDQLGSTDGVSALFEHDGAEMIAIYYDDPETTPAEALRADAALVIGEDATIPAGLTEKRIPGGSYARYSHIGSFDELGDVWARFLGGWLPQSGYSIGRGGTYEVYVSDMSTTAPEDFRTDLYVAVTEPDL